GLIRSRHRLQHRSSERSVLQPDRAGPRGSDGPGAGAGGGDVPRVGVDARGRLAGAGAVRSRRVAPPVALGGQVVRAGSPGLVPAHTDLGEGRVEAPRSAVEAVAGDRGRNDGGSARSGDEVVQAGAVVGERVAGERVGVTSDVRAVAHLQEHRRAEPGEGVVGDGVAALGDHHRRRVPVVRPAAGVPLRAGRGNGEAMQVKVLPAMGLAPWAVTIADGELSWLQPVGPNSLPDTVAVPGIGAPGYSEIQTARLVTWVHELPVIV